MAHYNKEEQSDSEQGMTSMRITSLPKIIAKKNFLSVQPRHKGKPVLPKEFKLQKPNVAGLMILF